MKEKMFYLISLISLILLASFINEMYSQYITREQQTKSFFELKKLCIKPVGIYSNRENV